jgi:hypothetical protein
MIGEPSDSGQVRAAQVSCVSCSYWQIEQENDAVSTFNDIVHEYLAVTPTRRDGSLWIF